MSFNTRNYIKVFSNALVLVSLAVFCLLAQAQSSSTNLESKNQNSSGSTPETEKTKDLRFIIEIGGQYRDVSGDRPSKFEEYKSVRNGFLFRRAAVEYNPEGSPAFFTFAARNASERDQQYLLDGGMYGRFRTKGWFDGQPHLFARGVTSLLARDGKGIYTAPDGIQSALQALDPPPGGSTTIPNPALIAATRSYMATTSEFDVRSQRSTFAFEQRLTITSNWSLRFRFLDTRRTGLRPLGTGTYERTGTAVGDTFRAHALELPAELDYRTDNFTFGTSYLTRRWGVNFDYFFSKFSNGIDAYVYDNPFRISDQATTGTGGAFNRQAFARGLHGTLPSNKAHGFMISGFVNLPLDSRWAGAFEWQRFTQNEPFLPFTLNTTITIPSLGGRSATDLTTLPVSSLDGEFSNITVDQLFTTRPWKNFALNLHYRAYDENNNTPQILFPGYAAFLEAFWRPNIGGSFGTRLIENEPASYLRQRASTEIVWDITKQFRWRGEYEWEGWNREFRQVSRSNENKFGTFFSYKPTKKFLFDLDYRYQERTPQRYVVGPLENQSLRMFDQAKRLRHDVHFRWQWAAAPQLGLSGDFAYLSDDYDQNFFGTTRFVERRGGIDLLFNPRENTTFYANYSREHYNTSLQSIAKTGAPFNLNNSWNRDDRNINDNFGAGMTTYLARSKWFLDVNYAMNYGRDLITTANIGVPVASAVTNATAYPFPEANYRYQEFNVDTNYQLSSKIALGFRYRYEPFSLNDWQWDGLSPYPVDQLAPETDGRRFLLLDSRYTDHKAHIVSLYVRFGN